jgi:hypothetical protein
VRGDVDKDGNQKGGMADRSLTICKHHPSEIKEFAAYGDSLGLVANRSMLERKESRREIVREGQTKIGMKERRGKHSSYQC